METSQKNVKEKNGKIDDLEQHIKEIKARHVEQVVKMEAQLAQQNKLIIFLQSKNEACKKKRVHFLDIKNNLVLMCTRFRPLLIKSLESILKKT